VDDIADNASAIANNTAVIETNEDNMQTNAQDIDQLEVYLSVDSFDFLAAGLSRPTLGATIDLFSMSFKNVVNYVGFLRALLRALWGSFGFLSVLYGSLTFQ
jgi:hypothetical protein